MGSRDDSIWKFRYEHQRVDDVTSSMPVFRHPLLSSFLLNREPAQDAHEPCKYDFIDPLGATVKEDSENNLTRLDLDAVEDISLRKENILDNTLETKHKEGPIRVKISCFSRLEILEDMSGLRRLSETSQNEFVSHVNKLRELLITAWQDNKRIEAVRVDAILVTELARLLSAPTTPSFFPVQWVLVTDILDLFGKLVYDRLFLKANEERKAAGCAALQSNFVSDDILSDTTEVARNWFCKIADIKEVVPRFYVESTLIGCLRFLDSATLSVNLLRLTKMVEKFPHPLSAAYARAYICKISMILEPTDRGPHWKALNDWMQPLSSTDNGLNYLLFSFLLSLSFYDKRQTEFIAPALEWIVQCVSYGATTMEDLGPLWEYCKQPEQLVSLLHPFVVAVSLEYLSNYCIEVCEIVSSHLYFSVNELSDLCELILEKLHLFNDTKEYFANLAATVENLVCCGAEDLLLLLGAKSFVSILDYIRDEPYGSCCAKALLTAVIRSFPVASVDNFHVINQIIEHCSRLCLSIRPDSITDEVRVIERVVSSALDRPFLHDDPERYLAFLVRARSSLYQTDTIIAHIINLMISLGFHFFNSQRSKKKGTFMRVLIANLFITIPSLNDLVMRFQFSLQTVYLSLLTNSVSQTEALLLFSLETLNELTLPPLQLLSIFAQFLALLVYVPDIPQKPLLFLFDSFSQVIQRRKWCQNQEDLLGSAWILCLQYLWAVSQPDFTVKFANVQSNDVYYGSSEAYRMSVMEKVDFTMQQVLSLIEAQSSTKPTVALSLLEFAVMRLEIEGPVVKLVSNLVKRCARSGQFESRVVHVIKDLTKLSETNDELKQALVKMKMLLGEQDSSPDVEVEEFRDLVRKRSDIETKMDYLDEEAKQVKLALELQKSMTDCYSNRASDCPLQTSIEENLVEMFYIQNEAKYICINLGDVFLSLRDHIYQVDSPLPAVDRELSNVLGSFTLQLPCCLIDLLAGCPDNDDPVNALRVLLPRDRFQSLPAGTSSTDALLVLNQSQKHLLRMVVTKEQSFFIVTVTLRDSTLRNRLRQALQVHVIHIASRILKRPSSNSLSIIDCSTLNELYDSVILSFST
ncbi:unnamed protein product [Angiostrongylus costaricensis]|uniref:UPF0505 protein C16orf62 homolog n=1 Tax=Angiostrongylus costaricensis TaxID=334426 RepID=A0A158PLM6_ANGCS|nr:unnamed protein product [Angiostrongylus costaricensis]